MLWMEAPSCCFLFSVLGHSEARLVIEGYMLWKPPCESKNSDRDSCWLIPVRGA